MILGQSAATAACLSIDAQVDVQNLDYALLRERLDADKQVLTLPAGVGPHQEIDPKSLPGVVVDDPDARQTGGWTESSSTSGFVGAAYLHDGHELPGEKSVTYELHAKKAGRYDVRMSYPPFSNRATNVSVTVNTPREELKTTVNQRQKPEINGIFHSLGAVEVGTGDVVSVTISNAGADGHVIADAVQLAPLD